jgi:hypothetical protein
MALPLSAAKALLSALSGKQQTKSEPEFDDVQMAQDFGGFPQLQSAVGVARGESAGNVDPRLKGLPKERLAQLDRVGQFGAVGQQMGALGLPSAAGTALLYEFGTKNPLVGNTLASVINAVKPGSGDQFRVDETTSKPSMNNVKAALRAYLAGMKGR